MRPDPALVAADRAARESALDVTRSFIVQAPAGSGKTELLIQRYLRLLGIVEQPEEIVAVTFTRKAAAEMQARVLAAMQDARDGKDVGEPHQRVTLAAAAEALARDSRMGWRLTDSPHRLRIQTIDALNASIARSRPLSSGLGAATDVVSDEAARSIYRAAAAATLDWLVSGGNDGAAVEQLLVHLDNDAALYLDHIVRMLETRDQWLGMTGAGRNGLLEESLVRTRLEKMIAEQVVAHLASVRELLPRACVPVLLRLGRYAAASRSEDGAPEHPLAALSDRERLPDAELSEVAAWRALADLLLTREGEWRRNVNRTIGLPPGEAGKEEMLRMLEMLAGHVELAAALHGVRQLPAARYPDEQWRVLLALLRVLPLAVAELRRILAEQRVTDYIEVAMAAHAALGSVQDPGDVALLLDYRVQHLLIDEMQDTSVAQYALIEKLVAGWQPDDGRTLFCVGDPMQSIYRFRNAEVGEFLLAREKGVGDVSLESLVLRCNFRSGERLVHWFNSVFGAVFPPADDMLAGAISYAESVPVEALAGQGYVRIHPVFGSDASTEAERGLQVVRDCLAMDDQGSIAILVRSRAQLKPLLARIRRAGIDYRAVDIDRLTDLPEIVDLLALTRALCHRDDRVAWLGLLRSPCVGLTWMDLHALVVDEPKRTVWELMRDEARVASLTPDGAGRVAVLVEELSPQIDGHGARTLHETVEAAWYRLGGPCLLQDARQVDNVYRFLDVLARLERAGTLTDVASLEERLDQEAPASGTVNARVQVMTMHRAKGLQFDHVVLYGLGRHAERSRKPVLGWLDVPDGEGGRGFLISPLGPRAAAHSDPVHDLIQSRLRARDRLEQDRLLYVACTRARRSLHLVGHVPLSPDGTAFRGPRAGSLLRRIWAPLCRYFEAAFSPSGAAPAGDGGPILVQPLLQRLPTPRPRPGLPAVPGRGLGQPAESAPDRPVDYDWAGAAARHAGSIVHRCMQLIAEGKLGDGVVQDPAFTSLTGRLAGELGIPGDAIDAVRTRARAALERVLRDPTGRWLLSGPGYAELPLTGVSQGRVQSVVIDRVRVDEAGVHWIVDYKTGTHEGGELERFLAQEVERYRPQLRRYADLYRNLTQAPVRTGLYFPLLQRFVEVPLSQV